MCYREKVAVQAATERKNTVPLTNYHTIGYNRTGVFICDAYIMNHQFN